MNLLKKTIKVSAIGALTASLAFGMLDAKAEDAGTEITAEVLNAFDLVETQALNFGTFVAISDAADTSTIEIATDGTTTVTNPGDARIVEIVPGVEGIFDVSSAAPNTDLTLTLPAAPVILSCSSCSSGTPDFSVDTFTSTPAVGSVSTNGSGEVTISVGATLETETSANAYQDGTYSGSYTVSVNY